MKATKTAARRHAAVGTARGPNLVLLESPRSEASLSNEWATQDRTFQRFNAIDGGYTLDAAAARWNAKCENYFDKRANGLKRSWRYHRVWLNPPYSRGCLDSWIAKARAEVLQGGALLVRSLVPAYTSEGWWHSHVEAPAGQLFASHNWVDEVGSHRLMRYAWLEVVITYLRGRERFRERNGKTGSARFASAGVLFRRSGVR